VLTPAQLPILKADILADPVLAAIPMSEDGAYAIADAYALIPAPPFIVWKTNVTIGQVGDAFDGTELGALQSAKVQILQCISMFSVQGINPSLPDRRQMFDDVFSPQGVITQANLLALWKRSANRGEKLYATGTGTTAAPATMTFEGRITHVDVQAARRL
jgi:hypothetical protein